MIKMIMVILLLLLSPTYLWAACDVTGRPNIIPASNSLADVAACVAVLQNNDIIQIPAGTVTWATGLDATFSGNMTIQGPGKDSLTITSTVTDANSIFLSSTGSYTQRVTGFTLTHSCTSSNMSGIQVYSSNRSTKFRIDNMTINTSTPRPPVIFHHAYGLVDHCTFNKTSNSGQAFTYEGDPDDYTGAVSLGVDQGQNQLYIENCEFNNDVGEPADGLDFYTGARVVLRYNDFNNTAMGNHGNDSSFPFPSTTSMEVYNNNIIAGGLKNIRGGTGVFYNNIVSDGGAFVLSLYRACYHVPSSEWGTDVGDGGAGAADDYVTTGQPGSSPGVDNLGKTSAPVYEWNNCKVAGCSNGDANDVGFSLNDFVGSLGGCAANKGDIYIPSYFMREDRDYFNNTEMPDYTAYQFPHELDTEHAGWVLTSADCVGSACLEAPSGCQTTHGATGSTVYSGSGSSTIYQ